MSNINELNNEYTGLIVESTIYPKSSESTYATHDAKFGRGGWQTVSTLNDLTSAIIIDRRTQGMAVYVTEKNKLYILSAANISSPTLSLSDWIEFKSGLDISGTTVINNNMIVSGGLSSNTLYVTKNFIVSNIPSSNNTKLSGYYYNRIDCFDKKNQLIETSGVIPVTIDLYLSSQQVTFEQGVANQSLESSKFYTSQFPLNYQVGDFISLVNGSYYGYCAKISKIDGNKITLAQLDSQFADDMKSNYNQSKKSDGVTIKSNKWWRNAGINDKGDYSIYVIQKVLSGIVDLANQNSIIVGNSSNSFGNYSYTRGTAGTTATGPYSTALGYQTYAVNYGTFAVGQYSRAQGIFSFAQGHQTSAILKYSHAEGNYTLANGAGSHAEGYKAIALGKYSHAEGNATSAVGNYSHAEGSYTVANNEIQHVQGQYNTSVKNTIHIVGYGNNVGSAKNPVSIETIQSTLSSLLHREALITLVGDQTSRLCNN